jgi:hypothetical protein
MRILTGERILAQRTPPLNFLALKKEKVKSAYSLEIFHFGDI